MANLLCTVGCLLILGSDCISETEKWAAFPDPLPKWIMPDLETDSEPTSGGIDD